MPAARPLSAGLLIGSSDEQLPAPAFVSAPRSWLDELNTRMYVAAPAGQPPMPSPVLTARLDPGVTMSTANTSTSPAGQMAAVSPFVPAAYTFAVALRLFCSASSG